MWSSVLLAAEGMSAGNDLVVVCGVVVIALKGEGGGEAKGEGRGEGKPFEEGTCH